MVHRCPKKATKHVSPLLLSSTCSDVQYPPLSLPRVPHLLFVLAFLCFAFSPFALHVKKKIMSEEEKTNPETVDLATASLEFNPQLEFIQPLPFTE